VFVFWLWALPMLELYVDVAVEKQGQAAALTLACAYLWQFHRPWLWSSAPFKVNVLHMALHVCMHLPSVHSSSAEYISF
jgi:hypothetical protein